MSQIYSNASVIIDDENSIIFNRIRGRKNVLDDKRKTSTQKETCAKSLFSCENMFLETVFFDAIPPRDKGGENI